MELLHFTGQVWRPPYEASSQLLQVTAGCTHNKCKFCQKHITGTKFRLSPYCRGRLEGDTRLSTEGTAVFLTGANPFCF